MAPPLRTIDGSIEWPEFRNVLIRWIHKELKDTLQPQNFSYAQIITRIFIQKCQVGDKHGVASDNHQANVLTHLPLQMDPDAQEISSATFADSERMKGEGLPLHTGCSTMHGMAPATEEEKAEARAVTKNILAAIQAIARKGQGEGRKWLTHPDTRNVCTNYFAELMAVCRVYRRPEEREGG